MNDEQGGGPSCPPHHWLVTTVRVELLGSVYHHRCIKCGQEKDLAVVQPGGRFGAGKWRKAT